MCSATLSWESHFSGLDFSARTAEVGSAFLDGTAFGFSKTFTLAVNPIDAKNAGEWEVKNSSSEKWLEQSL